MQLFLCGTLMRLWWAGGEKMVTVYVYVSMMSVTDCDRGGTVYLVVHPMTPLWPIQAQHAEGSIIIPCPCVLTCLVP
jgi:hypothetical protein